MDNTQLEALYKLAFPAVASMVQKHGGDLEAAKDIFHDALIIYMEKLGQPGFVLEKSPAAYILGVSRILAIRNFRDHCRTELMDDDQLLGEVPADFYIQWSDHEQTVLGYLQRAGRKCMQLLQAFYYEQMSMKDLAVKFGFGTVRSATVQKYKCMEKVRESLKKEEVYEEVFG